MTSTNIEKLRKKDVNVNTLFPVNLLQQLDEWAWSKRMTRSAALRCLVELAFEHMRDHSATGGSQPTARESMEDMDARIHRLEAAVKMLQAANPSFSLIEQKA